MDDDNVARERDLVEAYVLEHALEATLNELINKVVVDRPEDPFLVLSSLLYGKATSRRGIVHVEVREVLDASGRPGVLVRLHTGKGVFTGSCPSSVPGLPDRPDADDEFAPTIPVARQRHGGRGYRQRVERAQATLLERLVGLELTDQREIDGILLTLEAEIGRNVCLAASMAACEAGARYAELPLTEYLAQLQEVQVESLCLPMPLFSVVNAGKLASNRLFVQEIFVAPISATSFADALQLGAELQMALIEQLDARGVGFSNVGAFGGFAPQLQTIDEMFAILRAAMDELRMRLEATGAPALMLDPASVSPLRWTIGLDVGASAFVVQPTSPAVTTTEDGAIDAVTTRTNYTYNLDQWVPGSSGMIKSGDELVELIRGFVRELEVTAVIDPFDGGDIRSFATLLSAEHDSDLGGDSRPPLGDDPNCRLQVIGERLVEVHGLDGATEERACNTILLQLHQFPTISRALETIAEARRLGLAIVLGATVGESAANAAFLANFAVGTGMGQVKFGGLAAAECVARYNELLLLGEGVRPPVFVGAAYRR